MFCEVCPSFLISLHVNLSTNLLLSCLNLLTFCLSFSSLFSYFFFYPPNTPCCFPTPLAVLFLCCGDPALPSFLIAAVPSRGPEQYLLLQSPLMFTEQMQQDVIMVLKFPSNSPVTHVAANTQAGLTAPAIITVTANRLFAVNKWHGLTGQPPTVIPSTLIPKVFTLKSRVIRLISDPFSEANIELFPYSSFHPRYFIFLCRALSLFTGWTLIRETVDCVH